ncbi:MAG: hypothetical protein H6901_01540 [Rhodobacteraceae bacterium]|nr:hypothetical protein [Paracoccaceae bacterium]
MTDKPQVDKFKEIARALECDDDEAHFDAKLKKVAKVKLKDEKPDERATRPANRDRTS